MKLNENIEKWIGAFYFFTVEMTVAAVMIPKIVISFYLYLATDLRAEAFRLPFSIWCVIEYPAMKQHFTFIQFNFHSIYKGHRLLTGEHQLDTYSFLQLNA